MKPIASLSLDLDNKWSYLKTRGDSKWQTYPSYLDKVVPRCLAFLARHQIRITFFIVGRDAASDVNAAAMSAIGESDHEVGNHSFEHEPWLHLYPGSDLRIEVNKATEAIISATGKTPRGFRGPGFSGSEQLIEILIENGFSYECSALPTFIGPLARAFYFWNGPSLSNEDREKRRALFGKFSDGFQSLRPTLAQTQAGQLVRIPVTTFPIIKTPIHFSYLIYLASFSRPLARLYWRAALNSCRLFQIEPSLLLHSLDFFGADDDCDLEFFPGMKLTFGEKIDLLDEFVSELKSRFRIVTLGEHYINASPMVSKIGEYIENLDS